MKTPTDEVSWVHDQSAAVLPPLGLAAVLPSAGPIDAPDSEPSSPILCRAIRHVFFSFDHPSSIARARVRQWLLPRCGLYVLSTSLAGKPGLSNPVALVNGPPAPLSCEG
jgi:hypothetical protein